MEFFAPYPPETACTIGVNIPEFGWLHVKLTVKEYPPITEPQPPPIITNAPPPYPVADVDIPMLERPNEILALFSERTVSNDNPVPTDPKLGIYWELGEDWLK